MHKRTSAKELVALENQALELRFSDRPKEAKAAFELASQRGSGLAAYSLADGYCSLCTVAPESFAQVFSKDRRKARRFYNRALRNYRRQSREGDHRAMFGLYNLYNFGHPWLIHLRSRERLVELWLRKAAESNDPLVANELALYLGKA